MHFCRQNVASCIYPLLLSNPPECQDWGVGGLSQSWQCQDFESLQTGSSSLSKWVSGSLIVSDWRQLSHLPSLFVLVKPNCPIWFYSRFTNLSFSFLFGLYSTLCFGLVCYLYLFGLLQYQLSNWSRFLKCQINCSRLLNCKKNVPNVWIRLPSFPLFPIALHWSDYVHKRQSTEVSNGWSRFSG